MLFDSEKFILSYKNRQKSATKQLLIEFWDLETLPDLEDTAAVVATLLTGLQRLEKVTEKEEVDCHSLTDRLLKDLTIPSAIQALIKIALAKLPTDSELSPLARHAARTALKLLTASVASVTAAPDSLDELAEDLADFFRRAGDHRSEMMAYQIPGLSSAVLFRHSCQIQFAKGDLHLAFIEASSAKGPTAEATAQWFEALLEKDYRRLIRHRAPDASLDQKVHLWLLNIIFPSAGTSRRSVASPSHLRRVGTLDHERRRTIQILKVATFLDEINTAATLDAANRLLTLEFQKMLGQIGSYDSLLVSIAAAKNIAEKCGHAAASDFLQSQYQLCSERISEGKSDDLLLKDRSNTATAFSPPPRQSTAIITDRTLRFLKVSRSTIKLVGNLTVAKMQRFVSRNENQKNAVKAITASALQQFFSEISELRGALQKFIQLGFPISGDLPYVLRDELAKGTASSPPMNPERVTEELRKIYGDTSDLFSTFDPSPFACGSIGQVHRAVTVDGKEVCVKLRYPGIEETIKGDFRNIRTVAPVLQALFPIQPLKQMFIDWEISIISECNFELEKENHKSVATALAGTPVKTPHLYEELSRDAAIVTEFIGGMDFFEFIGESKQLERNRIGIQLWHSVYQLLKQGLFRRDIHPSNYKIENDRLIMLDLGVVEQGETIKALSDHFEYISAIARSDSQAIAALLRKNGWTTGHQADSAAAVICRVFSRPFQGEFEFNETYTQEIYQTITSTLSRILKTPRGDELNFRIFGSLYSMLALLKAKADWRNELAEFLDDVPPVLKLTN